MSELPISLWWLALIPPAQIAYGVVMFRIGYWWCDHD